MADASKTGPAAQADYRPHVSSSITRMQLGRPGQLSPTAGTALPTIQNAMADFTTQEPKAWAIKLACDAQNLSGLTDAQKVCRSTDSSHSMSPLK